MANTIFADGSIYVGNYSNGKPNGQGVITKPEGAMYIGQFHNGIARNQTVESRELSNREFLDWISKGGQTVISTASQMIKEESGRRAVGFYAYPDVYGGADRKFHMLPISKGKVSDSPEIAQLSTSLDLVGTIPKLVFAEDLPNDEPEALPKN